MLLHSLVTLVSFLQFLKDNAHLFPHLVTQEKEKSKGETQEQKVPQVAEVKVKSAEGTLVLEAQNGAVRALPVETDLPEPPKSVVHANGKSNGAASSLMRGEENGPGKCLTKYESKAWTQGMENVEFKKAIGRFRKMEEQTMTAWASVQALNSEDGGSHEVQWVVVDCLDRTGTSNFGESFFSLKINSLCPFFRSFGSGIHTFK